MDNLKAGQMMVIMPEIILIAWKYVFISDVVVKTWLAWLIAIAATSNMKTLVLSFGSISIKTLHCVSGSIFKSDIGYFC